MITFIIFFEGNSGHTHIDPPNGSVIANFEGGNASIFCWISNVTEPNDESDTVTLLWGISNYNGSKQDEKLDNVHDPSNHFLTTRDPLDHYEIQSTLFISNMSHSLMDGMIIYCGADLDDVVEEMSRVFIRVYSKLILSANSLTVCPNLL